MSLLSNILSRKKAAWKLGSYLKSTCGPSESTIYYDLFQGYDEFGVPLQAGDRKNKNKMSKLGPL